MPAPVPLAYLSLPTSLSRACAIFYGRTLFTCHGSPRGTSPDQCVQVGRAKMLFRARGNSCTWNWQRWRGHRCERWPGLIICRWFLSWPLLLSSSYCSCAACVAPSAALLASLACLVCLPVCLSVRLSVCLSGRFHFTAVKQLNLSRKLDKVRLKWRQGRGYCC